MPDFHFNESDHTYWLKGRRLSGVTEIISASVGSGFEFLSPADRDFYLSRGKAVHACAEFIAGGQNFTCDPRIDGHVQALRLFWREQAPVVDSLEKPLFNETYRFAGRPDLIGAIRGVRVIADYKNSVDKERIAWQLAAYAILAKEPPSTNGLAVELSEEGKYRLTWYDAKQMTRARHEFLAMRSVYSIRERLGITETKELTT